MNDITNLIGHQSIKIFSSTIDKEGLCRQYVKPYPPYTLAAEFLLERYSIFLNKMNQNGIIMLESRGKKEDKFVLKHLVNLLYKGNAFNNYQDFSRIKGVYFNKKWSIDHRPYPILELADLVSYPIHKIIRNNFKEKDIPFQIIESKIDSYPNYFGKGLKIFPENRKTASVLLGGRPGNPRSI